MAADRVIIAGDIEPAQRRTQFESGEVVGGQAAMGRRGSVWR
jgi:hypothetical protein